MLSKITRIRIASVPKKSVDQIMEKLGHLDIVDGMQNVTSTVKSSFSSSLKVKPYDSTPG